LLCKEKDFSSSAVADSLQNDKRFKIPLSLPLKKGDITLLFFLATCYPASALLSLATFFSFPINTTGPNIPLRFI
jgi:hypothetical protein